MSVWLLIRSPRRCRNARGVTTSDPTTAAVALERGRVKVAPGADYHPGLLGHARINFATSEARLTEIVHRLAAALT